MLYFSKWKSFLITLLCLMGLVFSLPNFFSSLPWPSWLPKKTVALGLDLRGGVNILLEVDTEKLFTEQMNVLSKTLRKEMRNQKIHVRSFFEKNGGISFSLVNPSDGKRLEDLKKNITDGQELVFSIENEKVSVSFSPRTRETLIHQAVEKSLTIVRKRLDETGTLNLEIQKQGKNRISVQIPGISDPKKVIDMLGKTAKLSFQWVQESENEEKKVGEKKIILPGAQENVSFTVDSEVLLTGDQVLDAKVQYGPEGKPVVSFTLTAPGAKTFSELTREGVGKRLAIVLDAKVLSAPAIKTHISDGKAVIDGMTSVDEAQKLALLIRSGALPAPLKILEEKVVGPGLGEDSIRLGTMATVWAVLAVSVFMVLSYSLFGLFSVAGIVFNVLFLLTSLSFLGATLTLPGIAGIALTIGMAVDANVLINERIKEELAAGKKLIVALDAGYRRAMTSILDSNFTTLMGIIILYFVGAGPIRGFAVTMALGIIISMFTAIQMTRFFISFWIKWKKPKTLWI